MPRWRRDLRKRVTPCLRLVPRILSISLRCCVAGWVTLSRKPKNESNVDEIAKLRNRYYLRTIENHALAVALDASVNAGGDVVLARGIGVAEVVQVGVLQLHEIRVEPLER